MVLGLAVSLVVTMALIIVQPETVIGWHRQGFRWYWTWKIRHGRLGRPQIPKETRELIRTMSRENVIWGAPLGAPRIRSELLKLGLKDFRGLRSERHGPSSETSISNMENISPQPRLDAGLIYMRARFYDPYTGQFLQPDPRGYHDSVNHYAGFAHNPVNYRDPTGEGMRF